MKYFQKSKIAFLLVTVLLFISNAEAVPGDLDTTFNGTGKSRIELGGASSGADGAAIQSDGKLIMVGGDRSFSIARYNTDGSKDTSFGFLGEVNLLTDNLGYGYAAAIKLQSDGKIVVAGTKFVNNVEAFAVVRINTNGSPDSSFGTNGVTLTPFSISGQTSVAATGNRVVIQSDGKIVVVGSFLANTVSGGATVRYTANGSLDTTFAGTGIRLDIGNQEENYRDVAIQSDGKIVVAGVKCCISHKIQSPPFTAVNTAGIIRRLNIDGTNDTSFSGDGYAQYLSDQNEDNAIGALSLVTSVGQPDKIVFAHNYSSLLLPSRISLSMLNNDGSDDFSFVINSSNFERVTALTVINSTIQSLRRILVAGDSGTGFRVTRLKFDESTDTSFGTNGIVDTSFPGYTSKTAAMVLRSGNLYIAGGVHTENQIYPFDFAAAKYDSNGVPDTSFGIDGKIIDDAGLGVCVANSIIVEPDGKSLVSGETGSVGTITRFNADGSVDTSFGESGRFKIPSSINGIFRNGEIKDAVRQPDGKIIAVASGFFSFSTYFVIVRINADGTLDNSFSGDGLQVVTDPGNLRLTGNSIALQPDGKIIVAGAIFSTAEDSDFAVYRVNSNGTLDLDFGVSGKVVTSFGTPTDNANSVTIQADNKIVVSGYVGEFFKQFAAARYNPDGSLDISFSFDGKVTTSVGIPTTSPFSGNGGKAMALQTDGKIIIVGKTYNGANDDLTMIRYNIDGTLDNSFGNSGIVITQVGEGYDGANDIAIQPDGKLIVVGSSSDGDFGSSSEDFAILRYNANGTLDSSFADPAPKAYGNGGIVLVDFGFGADQAKSVALDSVGRAVVVGKSGSPGQFSVARIIGNFAPTAANVSVSGRVLTPDGRGLRNAIVTITDSAGLIKSARSSTFGYFSFDEIESGQTYIVAVNSKSYQFNPQIIKIFDEVNDLTLTAVH